MSNYDIIYLGKKAEELGFVRDTLEKVTRLADILEYINTNPILNESLALKGGTAINLTIFNLPRLSVDIDMDYLINNSRDEMLAHREIINGTIDRYMLSQGYSKNVKTKNPHSLDSWVYDYKRVLNEHPFNKRGNVMNLFDGKLDIAKRIIGVIDRINERFSL